MANIPPKPPKIMAKKYVIYRILVIKPNGERHAFDTKKYTDELDSVRIYYRKIFPNCRILVSYHEKED